MSTKTAVVTGGAGFVGSHISDALKNEGWTVIVLDNLSSGKESNLSDKIELEIFDITKDNVETIFRKIKPDKIFHTAAQISVNQSTKNPFYDANQNIIGTIKVLDAIRIIGKGIEPFVFLSTGGAIYGNTDKFPVNENTYPNPESPYAISKFSAENYVRYFRRNYLLNTSIIRPANIYAPRQDPNGEAGVVAIFIKAITIQNSTTTAPCKTPDTCSNPMHKNVSNLPRPLPKATLHLYQPNNRCKSCPSSTASIAVKKTSEKSKLNIQVKA